MDDGDFIKPAIWTEAEKDMWDAYGLRMINDESGLYMKLLEVHSNEDISEQFVKVHTMMLTINRRYLHRNETKVVN